MAVIETSISAATAVVGHNLLDPRPEAKTSGANRVIRTAALAGSAAAGDTQCGVFVGGTRVATLFNTDTGFPNTNRDTRDLGDAYVPAGEQLSVLVEDAPATNPINLSMTIEEIVG
jgi:hypothetical protein